jgi:hypothetical protein
MDKAGRGGNVRHSGNQHDAAAMDETTEQKAATLGDDMLIGAPAIAEFLGIKTKAVYYLFRTKRVPIGKLGKNLIASRRKLRRAFDALY